MDQCFPRRRRRWRTALAPQLSLRVSASWHAAVEQARAESGDIERRSRHQAVSQKNFGELRIIRGLDLAVEQGERHAIIGPNGAGESTLFHLISGKLSVTDGAIRLHRRTSRTGRR